MRFTDRSRIFYDRLCARPKCRPIIIIRDRPTISINGKPVRREFSPSLDSGVHCRGGEGRQEAILFAQYVIESIRSNLYHLFYPLDLNILY